MLNIFMFISNVLDTQYNIRVYINELAEALSIHTDIFLYIVNYHYPGCKEFSTESFSPRYININIPSPHHPYLHNKKSEEKYASAVVNLLSDLIPLKGNVVFQTNCVDDLPIIKNLKKKYPYPVFSIADASIQPESLDVRHQKLEQLGLNKLANEDKLSLYEKEIYDIADRIISFTDIKKKYLVNNYKINSDKISTIPNGIEYSKHQILPQREKLKLKYELGFKPNEKIVLFCGQVNPKSEIFFLTDSFLAASEYLDNLRFVVIGGGHIIDCIQRYLTSYGKIMFTGFLSKREVRRYYQIADVGIFHSNCEPCPYTLLEMISHEIPVILSGVNGHNELFDEHECILVSPPINIVGDNSFYINEMKNAILSILCNKKLSKYLIHNALQSLKDKYSAKLMAIETNRLYTSMADFCNSESNKSV